MAYDFCVHQDMRLGVDGEFVEHLDSARLGFGASQKQVSVIISEQRRYQVSSK